MKDYRPSKEILEKYADVLVNFALGGGKGIKKGDVVQLYAEEYAKPLYLEVRKAIWKAGGHVISDYHPNNDPEFDIERDFFIHAKDHQINFFAHHYYKGLAEQIDHQLFINSETDKHALKGIDPKKLVKRGEVHKPWREWRNKKENEGKFTWTLANYATPAMATEAKMGLEEYWQQIIMACFLDTKNPVAEWKRVYKEMEKYRRRLNALKVEKYHIEGPDADLWIAAGEKRRWVGGGGCNIPSFELFTTPDWRGTNGWIKFNQPLYHYSNLITGVELVFKNGRVIKSKATKNENVLKEMIATPHADKIGEFSMTDKRFSKITRFMADTLFDENIGGPEGNTHIALGSSYYDCYTGDKTKVSKKQWLALGFNDSSVHTDIISTAPRTITAHLKNGKTKVIYKNGMYVV
ncbi:MAG: aminopeptidase [Patescibacteria group bacterium]